MHSLTSMTLQNLDVLRQVMSDIPVACFMLDKEHRVVLWNRGCEQATGVPAAAMLGTDEAWRAFYPARRPVLADLLLSGASPEELRALYPGQLRLSGLLDGVVEIEDFFPLIGAHGRWLHASAAPVRSSAGEMIGAIEMLQDVDAIHLAEKRIATLLDATPDAMLVVDAAGRIVRANRMSETIFGYPVAELLAMPLADLLPSRLRDGHDELRRDFFAAAAIPRGYQAGAGRSLVALRKDGSEFPVEVGLNRVSVGAETLVICSVRDVTEQRRVQEELRQAKEAAEAATQAKSDFLANMSHEIRTPMNAVIGLTRLALRGDMPERERGLVHKANAAAESLLGILNDILDFSRIEAGKLSIEYTRVELEDLLGGLVEMHGMLARDKGLFLNLEIAPEVPGVIAGDPLRLTQVLNNLCSNALKFTHQGGVCIKVSVEQGSRARRLVFSVSDTGIGLSAEQRSRLFQSFSQADTSTTRKYGGSGLGLAISKRLLDLMGGDIDIESQAGSGTRVRVSLPLAETLPADQRLAGKRILVVEDNDLSRYQMESLCRWFGMLPAGVADGQHARLEMRRAMNEGRPFDILMVDWLMPGEDGLACIQRMHMEFGRAIPPVVLVSSASWEEIAQAVKESGLELRYLASKPLHAGKLSKMLIRALGDGAGAAPPGIVQQAETLRGARVLLADDNEVNRMLACEWLGAVGIVVVEAGNGREALEKLAAEPVDAVLMDCQMPEMDGFEATRRIRSHPQWRHLPVIALSANALEQDVRTALAAGMDDYLSKPLREDQLYATLARWLARARRPAEPAAVAQDAAAGVPAIPGVDTAFGLKIANGKPELYRRVLRSFVAAQAAFPEKVESAVAGGDLRTAQRLAHNLKSGAACIGAEALAKEAEGLEKDFARAAPVEETETRLAVLRPLLVGLCREIGQAIG